MDFFLPPICPACRSGSAGREGLCAACLDAAAPEPAWAEGVAALAATGSAAAYRGLAEEMIKALKYSGRLAMVRPLGGLLANLLARTAAGPAQACDILAPVPLHPRRLTERGFNQSLLLTKELARQAGLRARLSPGLLQRVRYTRPQVELNGFERAANVRGAFAVAASAGVRGRRVLLIDDVCTTGATLRECAAALRSAGAAEVVALTVARAGS